MTELKKLPRDEEGKIKRKFEANGIEYTIRDPSEVMSGKRHVEFNRFGTIFAFGYDFASFIGHIQEAKRLVIDADLKDSLTKMKPLLKLEAIEAAIIEASKMKYDAAVYLCSIFVTSKDENILEWDFDTQTEKIDNWLIKEGYGHSDFLSLATISVPEFLKNYNQKVEEIESRNISL